MFYLLTISVKISPDKNGDKSVTAALQFTIPGGVTYS